MNDDKFNDNWSWVRVYKDLELEFPIFGTEKHQEYQVMFDYLNFKRTR